MPSASQIIIEFPTLISFVSTASCGFVATTGIAVTTATCALVNSGGFYTLTITNPFGASTFLSKSSTPFSFKLSNLAINPYSSQDSGTFTVSTKALSGVTYRDIDTSPFNTVFTPTPTELGLVTVTPSSFETCNTG
jgi:hypothetical protein